MREGRRRRKEYKKRREDEKKNLITGFCTIVGKTEGDITRIGKKHFNYENREVVGSLDDF